MAQAADLNEDPGWWFDRREEIARGHVLLSRVHWPGSDPPRQLPGDAGFERGRLRAGTWTWKSSWRRVN
jgi:hypothetical protein